MMMTRERASRLARRARHASESMDQNVSYRVRSPSTPPPPRARPGTTRASRDDRTSVTSLRKSHTDTNECTGRVDRGTTARARARAGATSNVDARDEESIGGIFSPPIDVVDRTRAGVGAREGRDGVDASGARARAPPGIGRGFGLVGFAAVTRARAFVTFAMGGRMTSVFTRTSRRRVERCGTAWTARGGRPRRGRRARR